MKKSNFNDMDKLSYNDRVVSDEWITFISNWANPKGKNVLDVGCGGGLYTFALTKLQPASLLGLDSSEEMIEKGLNNLSESKYKNVAFRVGNALNLDVETNAYDIILERALVHHLSQEDLLKNLRECARVLTNGGQLIIQDRTFEDCLDDSPNSIRRFFYHRHQHLLDIEKERRYSIEDLKTLLKRSGFTTVKVDTIMEGRKTFHNFEELQEDILTRRGRTILQHLSDHELLKMTEDIQQYFQTNGITTFLEFEPWTVVCAKINL